MELLVSVVIPSYKRPVQYVKRAVDSILSQTYENVEVIVVDDNPEGSSDRAALKTLFEAYAGDHRVRPVINPQNLGGSGARNEGIKAARGEYLAFLDDDDEFLPDKIEKQLAFMLENNLDMTFSDFPLVGDDGRLIDYREFSDFPKDGDRESLMKYHMMRHMTGTSTFMYKTEALRAIGGFQKAVTAQEYYLVQSSIEHGLKIGYFPGAFITAHYHENGRISMGPGKIRGENALYEAKKTQFDRLTPRERRYVRFRHWAVLTMVYKRDHLYGKMLGAALKMTAISPGDVVREGRRFLRAKKKSI